MGKNQSASNLPNIIQYSNGSINFVSGSTLLMQISSSGAITTTGVISGSNALSSSYAVNADQLDGFDSSSFVFTSSFNTYSSSMSTRTSNLESTGSTLTTASASFAVVSSSYSTASGSLSTRVTRIEGNYATTGSNVFLGAQTVCANITSTGTIIAQTLNVQQVTSSVVYSSGSNVFGNQLTDVQQITGSVRITGSLNTIGIACFSNTVCSPVQVVASCMSIGSSAVPNDLLTVYGSTNNGINICASDQPRLGFFVGGTSANNKIWDFIPQSNNTFIARVVNDALNASAVWMNVTRNTTTITSICFPQTNPMVISGCVGIGVVPNGPGLRLASCTVLRIEGACSGDVTPDNFGISMGGLGSFKIDCGGVGAGRFIVNSCGCVGINQPSPIFKLQVSSGGAKTSGTQDPSLFIGTSEVSNPWGLRVKPVGAASIGNRYVEFQTTEVNVADGGNIVFQNGGGNIGIGTSTPTSAKVVICGTTEANYFDINALNGSAGLTDSINAMARFINSSDGATVLIKNNNSSRTDATVFSVWNQTNPRLVILNNGSVGIGCASPANTLHVNGSFRTGGSSTYWYSGTDASGAYIENVGTTTATRTLRIQGVNDAATKYTQFFVKAGAGEMCFVTEDAHRFSITCDGRSYFTCQLNVGSAGVASNFIIDGSIANGSCVVSGTPGTARGGCMSGLRLYATNSGTSNAMTGIWFSTGPHWAGIASGRCDVNAGWGTDLRFYVHYQSVDTLDYTYEKMRLNPEGILTLFGYGAGTLSTNSAGVISASDGRLKTKTRAIESGLCSIMKLCPTYYRWNECTPFHTEYEELGFIAQEVSCIIPEASPEPEEEHKLKNYSDRAIIAMLTKGMQEQQCIIDQLKSCLGLV